MPGGEPVLQFDVPELVDRAGLPENAPPMRVSQKIHQRPWELATQGQPPSGEHVCRPRRFGHAQHEPEHEPYDEPDRDQASPRSQSRMDPPPCATVTQVSHSPDKGTLTAARMPTLRSW